MIKRTLSGESGTEEQKRPRLEKTSTVSDDPEDTVSGESESEGESGEYTTEDMETSQSVTEEGKSTNQINPSFQMPIDTPEWGKQLLSVIKNDFSTISNQISGLQGENASTVMAIKAINKKLETVEVKNKQLETENSELREKLLDLEYRQRRNNIQFDGFVETEGERDFDCYRKVCNVVSRLPGIDINTMKVERCHRL